MITTSVGFQNVAKGSIRPLALDARISFSKQRSQSLDWFTLDVSQLDGTDILATNEDDPIQSWDAYEWDNVRPDVIGLTWERSINFPYNVQSAICDLMLNNISRKYTYGNASSPYYPNVLPKRPMRTFAGFMVNNTPEVIPVFVGMTESTPKYSGKNDTTATFTALDFLSEIGNMSLTSTIVLRNATTDEVIAEILDQFGLDPVMYDLDRGQNVIPFAYFKKGQNAGNALQMLVQAENGSLWLNEQGVIRFQIRDAIPPSGYVDTLTNSDIVEIKPSYEDGIVNRVKVHSEIRQVQPFQSMFSVNNSNAYSSPANEDSYRCIASDTTTIWIQFENPAWSAALNPILNGANTSSNFTALDLSGNSVVSGVTAVGTLFGENMKLEVTNTNPFPISISWLEIWGEPAKVVDTIDYDAYDTDSIEKFGEQILDVRDNNYFTSYESVDSFAEDVLAKRAGYSPILKAKVKGNPALQLSDIIRLSGTDYDGRWTVVGIKSAITKESGFSCDLTLERVAESS